MWRNLTKLIRDWAYQGRPVRPLAGPGEPRIGLALAGGFARSLAHVGVLEVLEQNRIPIHCVAGMSSGAIIAGAYASGTPLEEIISIGACTSFSSYARWTVSKLGLASNERMALYLRRALRSSRFEDMRIPLAVVATDLLTGKPVVFKDYGDIIGPVRASCAYPGLFLPVEIEGRWLVDGAIATSVPVQAALEMGATHVLSVYLHSVALESVRPSNMLQVVSQCFSILQDRIDLDGRLDTQMVLEPKVASFAWNAFEQVAELVEAGRQAAREALPRIQGWLAGTQARAARRVTAPQPEKPLSAASAFPAPEKLHS